MQGAFTLVEVLLAMLIAVVLLTTIAHGMRGAHRGTQIAERTATATMLAARKIAELEDGELTLGESLQSGTCEVDDRYTWELTSEKNGELDQVTVRVLWAATGQELFRVMRLFQERS